MQGALDLTNGPNPPAALAAETSRFRTTIPRIWSEVRWENENKETLWRLAVDGLPLPSNTHLARMPPEPCGCGIYGGAAGRPSSPRLHHFWECPVARAVREQIEWHLQAAPAAVASGRMLRQHLWHAQPPPGCEQVAWNVIALAALSAMDIGRCCLRAAKR